MSTPRIVKALAPEFKDLPDADIQTFLDLAAVFLDAGVWGDKYSVGHAYMAAHMLSVRDRFGVGGPVTSEAVGGVSASYGSIGTADEELGSTSYGLMFVSLRRTAVYSPLVSTK